MQLKFIGATETVTGSKHLLTTKKGRQILLDCGLFQGLGKETDLLNRKLGFDPSAIEAVILSHAHIDHSGNLPYLVKQGFRGAIYCTKATYDVCEILLMDCAHIQESDIRFINKRRARNKKQLLDPLYTTRDVERCLAYFKPVSSDTLIRLNDEVSFRFTVAGHIVGAASIHIIAEEEGKKTTLTFTGDVGRYTDSLLVPPSAFPQSDYILCESTYGDRLHEASNEAEQKLLRVVQETCVHKKGKLIIPAFSLGRTQEIVFELNKLKNKNQIPSIKIYVDSPLSVSATNIVRAHAEYYNAALRDYIKTDPDPFGFSGLRYVQSVEESKALNLMQEPCIIISASGMCDAGRVKHHLKNSLPSSRNTVLIVGFCAKGTLGADLLAGKSKVHIYGEFYEVKAKIEYIHFYSAHADYSELTRFLSCQNKEKIKKIFLVHGEPGSKRSFREHLLSVGYNDVEIPSGGASFTLG